MFTYKPVEFVMKNKKDGVFFAFMVINKERFRDLFDSLCVEEDIYCPRTVNDDKLRPFIVSVTMPYNMAGDCQTWLEDVEASSYNDAYGRVMDKFKGSDVNINYITEPKSKRKVRGFDIEFAP